MPATILYNEGWLLRLVLDWYSTHRAQARLIRFAPEAQWYSEALLPSRFFRSKKREGYTHADAVIGHFQIRRSRGDVRLLNSTKQFLVAEAKLGSPLSSGTHHARSFNQAARNVACILNMLHFAGHEAGKVQDLGFLVLVPAQRLAGFRRALQPSAIEAAIRERDAGAQGHDEWCEALVTPEVQRMRLDPVAWEDLIAEIKASDAEHGRDLSEFYAQCLKYNGLGATVGPSSSAAAHATE